jgi:antitoxin component of MazEF toxin-antitoxin module
MSQQVIVSIGDAAAVLLSADDLHCLGVQIGDAIEICASHRQLLVRPVDSDRQQLLDGATEEILQTRRSAYQRLAD